MLLDFLVFSLAIANVFARPQFVKDPFSSSLLARQATNSSNGSSLQVDLGYAVYQGTSNSSTNLNNWRGFVNILRLGGLADMFIEFALLRLQ